MSIDRDDVRKLAKLTRLALSEDEEREAVEALGAVLGLVDQLKEAPVDEVDAMAYVQLHGQTLRTREAAAMAGYAPADILQNAPAADADHFLVPQVIE